MVIAIFSRERVLTEALTREALAQGHKVRCYQGRLSDYAMLRESVSGADAAICALGYPPEPRLRTEFEAGVRNVVYALEEERTRYLVALLPEAAYMSAWQRWWGRRALADWQRLGQLMRAARLPWEIVPQDMRIHCREAATARLLLDALENCSKREFTDDGY